MSNVEFYCNRACAAVNYGFKSGHEILYVIYSCAAHDPSLTLDELEKVEDSINMAHIKLMEENYNAD